MKKIFFIFTLFILLSSVVFSHEVKIEFENGVAYIPQVNGQDNLNAVRIEYANGETFFGRGTREGFPIEGFLVNYEQEIFYTGVLMKMKTILVREH